MHLLAQLTFLALAFLLANAQTGQRGSANPTSAGASCSRNYDFDQVILAIQWPSSFCYEKDSCNLQAARSKKWLIHGLWPNRAQRSKPKTKRNGPSTNSNGPQRGSQFNDIAFCCGPSYNASALNQTLQKQLMDKWPTLQANGKNHAFWNHEYKKHGTCARGVDALKTQRGYFETTLSLYDRFDLNRARLQSNQTYPLEALHRQIDPLVGGKRVRIECSLATRPGNSTKTSIFTEVRICLDKTLQPIDCTRGDDHQCRKRVLFP